MAFVVTIILSILVSAASSALTALTALADISATVSPEIIGKLDLDMD
ncbi:hypothetical protein TUM17383_00950 [Shewanella algae]|nr:hypothetical protein TUM17383_00950 [Shewanella algae]